MARPKQKPPNPISAAVQEWADQSRDELAAIAPTAAADTGALVAQAPKRWVTYAPMVLLPSGSFTSPPWPSTLAAVSQPCRDALWKKILRNVGAHSPGRTTHLAVNDGIPRTVAGGGGDAGSQHHHHHHHHPTDAAAAANILRSPVGLRTLYGDFGPAHTRGAQQQQQHPSAADFAAAFWVSTKQNGVHQTWAPRWTMFSRGNVKEKARLLAFRAGPPPPAAWAVDLYGGIGYFVFAYARRGLHVLCWELNPWSAEGLRRGARANGWAVRVVAGAAALRRPTAEAVAGIGGGGAEDEAEGQGQGEGVGAAIVVFVEDNAHAARRLRELRAQCGRALPVAHVNCGLLPRSDGSWEAAREIVGAQGDGWLHLHENVGVKDIESRKAEIQCSFDSWDQRDGRDRTAKVEHVELVKTFAPDVWHCVFDVYITKSKSTITPR